MTSTVELVDIRSKQGRIDLLDRQDFVERLINVAESLANNQKNACYAIDGSWGVGKSFVLDLFEEELSIINSQETVLSKYLVFRYDSWKYDYYEEPLVAIVASMLDQIDEKVNLLSSQTKSKIKGILKAIICGVSSRVSGSVKEHTGIDLQAIKNVIDNGNEDAAKEIESNHDFDSYYAFKKVLQRMKGTVASLAEDQTVIFVVDELDRCLPEYTIKVLERLHHVFDDVPNVQVILSIDKMQLGNIVNQIFGSNTSTEKYLAKFIDFELKLDAGSFNDKFDAKFDYYVKKFEIKVKSTKPYDISAFKRVIFEGMDVRNRIAIIERCTLLHDLLNGEDENKDFCYMCIEMFLAVIQHWKIDLNLVSNRFNSGDPFLIAYKGSRDDNICNTGGLKDLGKRYNSSGSNRNPYHVWDNGCDYVNVQDIWGLLYAIYRQIAGFTNDRWHSGYYDEQEVSEYANRFWDFLQMIQ